MFSSDLGASSQGKAGSQMHNAAKQSTEQEKAPGAISRADLALSAENLHADEVSAAPLAKGHQTLQNFNKRKPLINIGHDPSLDNDHYVQNQSGQGNDNYQKKTSHIL
jgi:hypothetical protein